MMLSETPTRRSYTNRDCAIAALAGAVANRLALVILSPSSQGGGIFLLAILITIDFAVLVSAGKPMARKLAASGRDTLVNGFLFGAAIGWLTGAFLTGVVMSLVAGSPSAAFSIITPLSGLYFGVVDGAASGVAFVCLGRRKSVDAAAQPAEQPRQAWLRWPWVLVALGLGGPAAAIMLLQTREKSKPENFPIAGTIYRWPADTTIIPPDPPGSRYDGKGYVRYRSSHRHPDDDSFFIVYDGRAQAARNRAGLPHLHFITDETANPEDFTFRDTPVGQVVCNRRIARLAFSCGLTSIYRNARWQLQFAAHQSHQAERLYRESIARLETFRRRS